MDKNFNQHLLNFLGKAAFISLLLSSITIFAVEIEVNSTPDVAQIYIRGPKNKERKLVGQTPYKGDFERLSKSMGIDNDFIIEIEKEGYEPYNLFVAKVSKADIRLLTTLKAKEKASENLRLDSVVMKLFDAQRFVRAKAYDEAIRLLDTIETEANQLSSYYEMKGGALYLKKDFNGALANYRKALSLNENNVDALSMKNYLENVLGEKKK